uniref:Uncharacterized protein n=1 Tax=Anopheles atroparvus TaxID=41427 RepID=A0A182J476_ANOAO
MTYDVLDSLQPHRELIGQVAGLLTVSQYLAGWFICADIRHRGITTGVSPLRFIGGSGLQYSLKLHSSALIWTSICTLVCSLFYSSWFLWYTPNGARSPFYRLAVVTSAVTAGVFAYGSQNDSPLVMFRLGLMLTVLALAFIALPLAQLLCEDSFVGSGSVIRLALAFGTDSTKL